MGPMMHYQMCIVNGMALFMSFFMLLLIAHLAINPQSYKAALPYLIGHNTLVSMVFFIAFILGKSKSYFKYGLFLFHANYFIGCMATIINVGTQVIFIDVFPYLCLQLLVVSFFYNPRRLLLHASVLAASFIGLCIFLSVITIRDLTYSLIMLSAITALGGISISLRSRIISQFSRERINSRLNTLHEVNSGISHNVNNPLTIITSAHELVRLELLKTNPNKAKILDLIERSEITTVRISETIKSLNDLSDTEHEKHSLSFDI